MLHYLHGWTAPLTCNIAPHNISFLLQGSKIILVNFGGANFPPPPHGTVSHFGIMGVRITVGSDYRGSATLNALMFSGNYMYQLL
jgi:hypothetical protein